MIKNFVDKKFRFNDDVVVVVVGGGGAELGCFNIGVNCGCIDDVVVVVNEENGGGGGVEILLYCLDVEIK
jgi:hypothetical protein